MNRPSRWWASVPVAHHRPESVPAPSRDAVASCQGLLLSTSTESAALADCLNCQDQFFAHNRNLPALSEMPIDHSSFGDIRAKLDIDV